MERIKTKNAMSLYANENGEHQYLLNSMGVAYKLDDEGIWFVKVPIDNGNIKEQDAVMVRVLNKPVDHEENKDEFVPPEAVDDVIEWYKSEVY